MNLTKKIFQKLPAKIVSPSVTLLLLMVALAWGFVMYGPRAHAQSPPPARVVISRILFETLAQNHPFIGTLNYDRISQVSSEIPGLVTRVDVRAGDRVSTGKPLVHLNTEILDKEMLIQKNLVDQATLHTAHLQKNFLRMNSLFKKGSISEKDYDDAGFFHEEALLKKISAATLLEKMEIQKRKSVILAPFDGIVLEKNVDSGDWVLPGKALISIGSVNDLFIRVPVAETLLKYLSLGQTLPVTLHAYDREMVGTIDSFSPLADAKTKNVFLNIRIPLLSKVAQNMSATVLIPTGDAQTLAMIPRDALVQDRGQDFVYTIKDEKALMLPVHIVTYAGDRVGADNAHFTEGMPLVVDGNERLRPNQPVIIVGE